MRRGSLARRYLVVLVALVTGALVTGGAIQLRASYSENQAALVALQREKALGAAARIEAFVRDIERQLGWTTHAPLLTTDAALDARQLDALRLQRQAPPITELTYIDAAGREQLFVSRLIPDRRRSGLDLKQEPRFREVRGGRAWFGPVYFRKDSEPYMTIAAPLAGGGVVAADVNLKFILDVVSQIKVGKTGLALAVDAKDNLIAHPDISLVLQKTSLAQLPQVKGARTPGADDDPPIARDLKGVEVLTAHSRIPSLDWIVFVEQPVAEAFAPVRASAYRVVAVVLAGIALSVVVSVVLARRLARPIQQLQESAARIGAGELDHQIALRTGDELEALADEFNRMTGRLRESYATLEQKVDDRTRLLTESLEQQTATAEILRAISGSLTDVQPVFDAIVRSAQRLLHGHSTTVFRVIDGSLHLVGLTSVSVEADAALRANFPAPLASAAAVAAHVVETRQPYVITDIETDRLATREIRATAPLRGYRSMLLVPMLREGRAVGLISVTRALVGGFTRDDIALLQTFADQAVIAIENVRLFKELEAKNAALAETVERQTATAEILRAISSSPTDVQPVFDTILSNALRLGEAHNGAIFTFDGERFRLATTVDVSEEFTRHLTEVEITPGPQTPLRRVGVDGRVSHAIDIFGDPSFSPPEAYHREGMRTALAVPLLKEGRLVGALTFHRRIVRAFSPEQIALLQTFADQAVIAIENVRLFTELQARTADLTRSVGELEALGEVSRVISSTLDLDRVLETIVSRANELAGTDGGAIFEFDEPTRRFHLRATDKFPEGFVAGLRASAVAYGEGAVGRAAAERQPVQIGDVTDTAAYGGPVRDLLLAAGYRSLLAVPLLSEDEVVGALVVNRRVPGEFPARVVDLLRRFGTQSALAIQNARLFREIEDKSRELESANRHKDEFLASMSHELRTPLNAVIGFSEVLLERMFGELNDKQEEYLNDILASGRHLLSLINDILDLAKIEAGRMELDVEDFELAPAIDNALVLIRERATRKGLNLGTTLPDGLGNVRGDQRKIKQVLVNLLSNAVKFTPEGGSIEVRAERVDGHVEVSIIDTGIGIASEDHDAVFEEFRQVGTDYAKKHEGTGLGLALSRKFVELHGGRIWLKSRPGEGSTFTFTIPVA
jgi:signal transduction histidine kinase/HAMP domain-containing protein